MSTASNPVQNEDFTDAAASLATPVTGEAVSSDSPVPTDKYLTPADVAATKAAESESAVTGDLATDAVAAVTPKGEPPADKWDTILDNARRKARAEVEGEYAWAKDVNREDFEATRKWIATGNQNVMLALDQLVQGIIKSNPDQKGQVERYFKSILQEAGPAAAVSAAAAGSAASVPDPNAEPGPDIPTDTSNGVPVVYSAGRMKEYGAWLAKQIKNDIGKDLAPIISEREQKALNAKTEAYTERSVAAISGLPGFEENRAEIASAYAAIPLSDDSRTEGEKLRDAYLTVVSSKMSEVARREAVASVTRRAEASTVNPSSPASSQPFDYKKATWEQALRHEFNSSALGR